MKTTIMVQARMSSARLPGKILKKIGNLTIIELINERLKKSQLADDILVAASNSKADKPLIDILKKKKLIFSAAQRMMHYLDSTMPQKISQK